MKRNNMNQNRKTLLDWIPHPLALLFYIAIIAAVLTYMIPAGSYEREMIDGASRAIPGSFEEAQQNPVGIMDVFTAFPEGFKKAYQIIFITFAAAMMFGVFDRTGMMENTIGSFVRRFGLSRRYLIVVIMTFIYGFLGIFVGLENNIALVPIAAILSLAIGGDAVLGAGMAIGGILVGFGLSPFNPYTVGVGHDIADMPLFSGWGLRTILVMTVLSLLAAYNVWYLRKIQNDNSKSLGRDINTDGLQLTKPLESYRMQKRDIAMLLVFLAGLAIMLYGVFAKDWYINEIAAVFLIVGIVDGLIARMNANKIAETFANALGPSAFAAILIGVARSIQVILDQGNITDTIAHGLVTMLDGMPSVVAAVGMTIVQSIINLFIPSGSGQALVTLPILVPVSDMIGITRQAAILAFQVGDGLTNMINPTLGGLMAMLGILRVPFGKWLQYIVKFAVLAIVISWIALVIAVLIGYGPA